MKSGGDRLSLYYSFAREHLALVGACIGIVVTVTGFIVGTFATISYVDAKHSDVVKQQDRDREHAEKNFSRIDNKLDRIDDNVLEILRFQRKHDK